MNKILNKHFYNRPTLVVAKELLGKFIVRKIGKKELIGKIVEVEAYNGSKDLASHASRGMTERNAVMFGHAGHAYVYIIYGMYYCFNIVTEDHGYPAAVLIRAVEITKPHPSPLLSKERETNGPGKFCRAFKINKKLNGADLSPRTPARNAIMAGRPLNKGGLKICVEDRGVEIKKADIISAKRIGVDYAKEYKDKLWRFYIKGNGWVSKK